MLATLAASLAASAAVTAFALRSGEHAWLGCLSLVPLFSAIRWLRPWAAGASGAFWGVSLLTACLAGLGPAVEQSVWSSSLLVLAPGIYCALGAALTRWIGFSPFVLGVGWMAVELATVPVGLHAGLLGGTQEQTALMDFLGRALGHVLVAFLVAYLNAILVELLVRVPVRALQPPRRRKSDEYRLVAGSQTLGCPSLLSVRPSHPRAPPLCLC